MDGDPPSDRERRLDEVIAAYLEAAAAGDGPPDRQLWLDRHPDLAAELAEFFADSDLAERAAAPLRAASLSPTLDATPATTGPNTGELRPGTTLGDHEILRQIGAGGMGVVYVAHQKGLNRTVAVKTIRSTHLIDDSDVRRFRTEAESAARLQHPNIVTVYEVGEHDGCHYFTMEHIDGPDMGAVIADGPLEPARAARYLREIASAVQHAHERGVLHRDLKPTNILLDAADRPRVGDFGLARIVHDDAEHRRPEVLGTPSYMSPEHADDSRDETTLSDVYGLGAILYCLLTGQAPFRGTTLEATLRAVRDQAPAPPSSLNPDVDPDLEALCLKCLRKNPEARYESAEALAEDLARWQRNEETSARPWSRPLRIRRWCQRNPWRAWWLLTLIVLVAVAATLVTATVRDMLQEPARAQRELVRQKASSIDVWLRGLAAAVEVSAVQPGLAEAIVASDATELRRLIDDFAARRVDLGGRSPFESWFLLDLEGRTIARWPVLNPGLGGADLSRRDYFRAALESHHRDPARASISRVFRSLADGHYKFAVSVAVVHDATAVGVLVASVSSASLQLPSAGGETSVTVLLAARDPSQAPASPADGTEYVILEHPAYGPEEEPAPFPDALRGLVEEGLANRYLDPVAARHGAFAGPWLAAFAPLPGTPFVVVAQRRSPSGSSPDPWLLAAAGAVAALLLVAVWDRLRRKSRSRASA